MREGGTGWAVGGKWRRPRHVPLDTGRLSTTAPTRWASTAHPHHSAYASYLSFDEDERFGDLILEIQLDSSSVHSGGKRCESLIHGLAEFASMAARFAGQAQTVRWCRAPRVRKTTCLAGGTEALLRDRSNGTIRAVHFRAGLCPNACPNALACLL